jgi:hypothetical protein
LKSEKRVILSLPTGFATAVDSGMMCTSLISYVFDYHLQEMERDGFIATAWKNHVEKISTIRCDKSTTSSVTQKGNVSLGMKDMGGIFITHSIILYQGKGSKQESPPVEPYNQVHSTFGMQK